MTDLRKLYESYAAFIRTIGGEPLSYNRWLSANPNLSASAKQSDIDFDYAKECEGDAQ